MTCKEKLMGFLLFIPQRPVKAFPQHLHCPGQGGLLQESATVLSSLLPSSNAGQRPVLYKGYLDKAQ